MRASLLHAEEIQSTSSKNSKQIVYDYYNSKTICEAKNVLSGFIDGLNLVNWTRPLRRRKDSREKPGAKLKQDIDDIVLMITFVDENGLFAKIPKFVTSNPDNQPSAKMAEGDLHCILAKLNSLTSDVNQLTTIVNQLSASLARDVSYSVDKTLSYILSDKIPDNIDLRITAVGKDVTEQLSKANENISSLADLLHHNPNMSIPVQPLNTK